jgi:hypothetical protein
MKCGYYLITHTQDYIVQLSTHIQLFVYATTLCILDEQNMITVKMNFLFHELDFDIFSLLMMVDIASGFDQGEECVACHALKTELTNFCASMFMEKNDVNIFHNPLKTVHVPITLPLDYQVPLFYWIDRLGSWLCYYRRNIPCFLVLSYENLCLGERLALIIWQNNLLCVKTDRGVILPKGTRLQSTRYNCGQSVSPSPNQQDEYK